MQLYIAIALTIMAFVMWTMAWRIRLSSRAMGMPPPSRIFLYNITPLAGAWLVALLTPANDNLFYKGAVVLGMLLALIGLALRESDVLPSYVAHAHLVLTYVLYAYAFSSQTTGWPSLFSLILVVAAGALYFWLYPNLREIWVSVTIYGALLLLTTWQALELAVQHPNGWMGWAALVGMLIAVGATMLEAQASFLRLRPSWAFMSAPLFFLAQIAIAWSVWG